MAVNLRIHPRVKTALAKHAPVVALESTVITHGLPKPQNLELAQKLEDTVRQAGAVAATIAILGGELIVGLEAEELHYLANTRAQKASLWNLAALLSRGEDAGTTVATTLHIAALAGIKVFATGGIGGVHHEAFDESADIEALARYRLITVCAGPKSILNVGATLQRLESRGIPVIGYRSERLAGFYVEQTSYPVAAKLEQAADIARCYQQHCALGLPSSLLVSKPVSQGLEAKELAMWIKQAQSEVSERQLSGKDVTPFLLSRLAELSKGRSVAVNLRLLEENARLAAEIAVALADVDRLKNTRSLGKAQPFSMIGDD